MRRVIVAALAMTPMLLHAQANSPAKTQPQATVLQSKMVKPEVAAAASDTATATPAVRISTGVTAPKIISTVDVIAPTSALWTAIPTEKSLVVSLVVDESGKPKDVKIVKSAGTQIDEKVLEAVSQYRFKPGTLDNAPTAVPMNLEITVQHGSY